MSALGCCCCFWWWTGSGSVVAYDVYQLHTYTMYHARVSCIMYHVSSIVYHASCKCIVCHVSCIMHHASCIVYHASCIMYRVSCIMYHVSCIMYRVSCIVYQCIMYHAIRGLPPNRHSPTHDMINTKVPQPPDLILPATLSLTPRPPRHSLWPPLISPLLLPLPHLIRGRVQGDCQLGLAGLAEAINLKHAGTQDEDRPHRSRTDQADTQGKDRPGNSRVKERASQH